MSAFSDAQVYALIDAIPVNRHFTLVATAVSKLRSNLAKHVLALLGSPESDREGALSTKWHLEPDQHHLVIKMLVSAVAHPVPAGAVAGTRGWMLYEEDLPLLFRANAQMSLGRIRTHGDIRTLSTEELSSLSSASRIFLLCPSILVLILATSAASIPVNRVDLAS